MNIHLTRTAFIPSSLARVHDGRMAMARLAGPCFLWALFALTLAYVASAETAPPPVIRIGVEQNIPPLSFRNARQQPDGFTAEYLQEVASHGGIKFEVTCNYWSYLLQEFNAGRLDALANVVITENRRQTMDFSIGHASLNAITYTRTDSPPIRTTAEFKGKVMILVEGTVAYMDATAHHGWGARIITCHTWDEFFGAIKKRECDFGLLMQSLTAISTHTGEFHREFVEDIRYTFHIAVHRGNASALALINEGIAGAAYDGDFDRLYAKWIGPIAPHHLTWRDLRPYLWPSVATATLITAVFLWMLENRRKLAAHARELEEAKNALVRTGLTAKVGGWELDLDTKRLSWTQVTRIIHEVDDAFEPTLDQALKFYAPESRPVIEAAVKSATETGRGWNLDLQLITARNRQISVRAIGVAVMAQGRLVALRGTFQDISEYVAQEREILLLNRMYATLSQVSQAMVHASTTEQLFRQTCQILVGTGGFKIAWIGRVDAASKVVEPVAIAGDERGYLTGIRISVDPNLEEGRGPTGIAFREGQPCVVNDFVQDSVTAFWRDRADSRGIRSSMSLPIQLTGGGLAMLTVYSGEINFFTARKMELLKATALDLAFTTHVLALKDEKQKSADKISQLLHIIEQAPLSIVITDHTGRIEYVNPRFSAVTGYTRDEAIGQNPRILNSGETPREVFTDLWQTLTAGRIWSGDLRNRKKNGEIYLETAIISPVADSHGQVTHYVAIKDDVTAHKRFEAESIEKIRKEHEISAMKTRFIAFTSHEFRTPMTTIQVATELLHHHFEKLDNNKREELFGRIENSLHRLAGMLDEILLLSRMDVDNLKIRIVSFDSLLYVRDIVDEYRLADKGAHEFVFLSAASNFIFETDSGMLRHIVTNLLDNAVRYSARGTAITVRLEVDAWRLKVVVQDHGIGIPAGEHSRIFEPFERGSNSSNFKGSGLGLNIVKRMTLALGGTVTAEDAEGGGARFTVALPRGRLPANS